MSLLRKIRRQHKAFLLKRSAHSKGIGGNGGASVCSVDGGDEEDEDEDSILTAGQTCEQNVHVSVTAPPIHVETAAVVANIAQQTDVLVQSVIHIPSYATKNGDAEVAFIGRENRFWPWIAKTAVFMLVFFGATYIGKVASLGITLFLAIACRLFARELGDNHRSSNCAESGQGSGSDECIPLVQDIKRQDGHRLALYDESFLGNNPVHILNNDAEKDMERNHHGQSEEVRSTKADGDTDLLAKRKQLKRLNCIKLPPSASPFGECVEQSPSGKASPRTWFRNAGTSNMVAGSSSIESPTGNRKHGKFQSKVFFKHLKKGELQSVPSSPVGSDSEAVPGCSVVSDGIDSERPIQCARVRTKSNFRPASPVSVAGTNMRFLDEQRSVESLSCGKGEINQTPVAVETPSGKENGMAVVCPAVISRGEVKQHNINGPLSENGQSECITSTPVPASGLEIMKNSDVPNSLCRKGRTHQTPWKHVSASVSLHTNGRSDVASEKNQDCLLPAARTRGGERKQQEARVGIAWLTSGFAIVTAALIMGRIVAVAGLVCYWYALSLIKKSRKALENT